MADASPLLPVLNCDGCGACCLEQESPPGYLMFVAQPDYLAEQRKLGDRSSFAADVKRYLRMPKALKRELKKYGELIRQRQPHPRGGICIWYDEQTRGCRHYEWRPDICREFDLNSDGCHHWRKKYEIEAS